MTDLLEIPQHGVRERAVAPTIITAANHSTHRTRLRAYPAKPWQGHLTRSQSTPYPTLCAFATCSKYDVAPPGNAKNRHVCPWSISARRRRCILCLLRRKRARRVEQRDRFGAQLSRSASLFLAASHAQSAI